jgi:MYXO-CTERM domain-containing protein
VVAALVCATRPAGANGRFPRAGVIAVDPSDPGHIVVRATYGLLSTADGGKTWSWVCEQSVGFSDNEDPMVAITKNGTLLAGVSHGLGVSTDRGCDWSLVGGELSDRYAVDLATEKNSPERAVAILSNGIGGGKFDTTVFESADDGATWSQAGVSLPEDFYGLAIDAAPSDTNRLYASGRSGAPDYLGVIERSDDRGKTWQRFAIPGATEQSPPFLSAVDPNDPDVLYVRLDSAEADVLVVSRDGGLSWETAFEGNGPLLGFALSPDGKKVAVGGDKDGIRMAPADTLVFEKVSDLGAKCLLWTSDAFYACGEELENGFTIGISKNEGKTFQALHHLGRICPLECPSETTTEQECPSQWGAVALTLDAESCDADPPDAGPPSSAAASGSSNDGGREGCACNVAGGGALDGGFLFIAAALSVWARRRRRQPRV